MAFDLSGSDSFDCYEYIGFVFTKPLIDMKNPFELLDDASFQRRYRMRKSTFLHILQELNFEQRRANSVPPLIQLCITLRFYATGSYQISVADLHGIHRTTVCKIIKLVSERLASLCGRTVKFPSNLADVKSKFRRLCRIPNVIGAIDCTHVRIQSPGGDNANLYVNRKGYFSFNVQAVVGPDYRFYDFVCRWAGSTHDSRIFNHSQLHQRLERGEIEGILLGDSGYSCTKFLLTPLLHPQSSPENRYNSAHRRGRCIVERTFGIWKRKFSVLSADSRIRLRIDSVMNVCCACAYLHNTLISLNDEIDDESYSYVVDDHQPSLPENDSPRGSALRRSIIDTIFA